MKIKKTLELILFYTLSLTWGLPMTLIGALITLALLISGNKPKTFHGRIYFEIGRDWGGVNFGPFFLVCENSSLLTKQHECGHGLQNILLGPLMPLIVSIPSAIRYWLIVAADKEVLGTFCSCALLVTLGSLAGLIIVINLGSLLFVALAAFLTLYICILFIWSVFKESPKYEAVPYPDYDSVWFESSATNLGKKYFKEKK